MKSVSKKTITGAVVGTIVGAAIVVVGLAIVHHHGKSTSTNTTSVVSSTTPSNVPIEYLPSGAQEKLSSFASRLHVVHQLPIQVKPFQNVLYLGPGGLYAIDQFRQVWAHIKNKPTVVWTANQVKSQAAWKQEGFQSDPLPSPHTLYKDKNLPVPDAYHLIGKHQWAEMPGILRMSEVVKWPDFFVGKYDILASNKTVSNTVTVKTVKK